MNSVQLFHIRDIDSRILRRERERALRLIQEAIPFACAMEVGSTAVEGVVGKQDLDFVARVPVERFEEARKILDRHFQRNENQLSSADFQGYLIASPIDVALQLIVAGGQYDDFEKFLTLLRTDRALRDSYNALKLAWNGRPMADYRSAKQTLIQSALKAQK